MQSRSRTKYFGKQKTGNIGIVANPLPAGRCLCDCELLCLHLIVGVTSALGRSGEGIKQPRLLQASCSIAAVMLWSTAAVARRVVGCPGAKCSEACTARRAGAGLCKCQSGQESGVKQSGAFQHAGTVTPCIHCIAVLHLTLHCSLAV